MGIIATVFAIGSFASLFSMFRFEQRASEAHRVSITGERDAQKRASDVHTTFLEGSKTTLELVNATLTLAQEAGERAARFLENKARITLLELDTEARDLLTRVDRKDDRALIADEGRRATLLSLAQKINQFEINRFFLPVDLPLTPAALFIRGMEFHLDQQYNEAITHWKRVALSTEADNNLRSLAWYWIGYEHNNLAEFADAVRSFEQALDYATGSRRFELERILLESRFFNKTKESASLLIQPLENLLERIEVADISQDEKEARKTRILGTLGNLLFTVGRELQQEERTEEARVFLTRATNHFGNAADVDKWARFGLAETLWHLGEVTEAAPLWERVRDEARDDSVHRVEPRTKVLAATTELICCLRVPELSSEFSHIHSQVVEALGRVDQRLTVYSQLQRRNVTKEDFLKELRQLERERVAGQQLVQRG